jgi:hypothetical protein
VGAARHRFAEIVLSGQTGHDHLSRNKVEAHLKITYLKKVQAPQGVKAALKCWMELS